VHYGGTLAQTRTDSWETPAEVRMLRTPGADVTCTLDGTYIVYAKQAGIHYATAQIVMNYGEGLRPNDVSTTSEEGFARIAKSLRMTLLDSIYSLRAYKHNCLCFRVRAR
jgi:purine nucleoside phosphorylase